MLKSIRDRLIKAKEKPALILDQYVATEPSYQNAIDAVPGWNTRFPDRYGVKAGPYSASRDQRLRWGIDRYGSLQDRVVLELGPLEGGHTAVLEEAGAQIDAIEANRLAFLRCLVTKEIMSLTRCKFWHGDFVKWLETTPKHYDLIVASGVLYHLNDPLRLIELAAEHTSALYLWTHVFSEQLMPPGDRRRRAFFGEPETQAFHGVNVRTHRRNYLNPKPGETFCGGIAYDHRWIEKADLIPALKAVGFQDIETAFENADHRFGPALSVFARK